MVGTQVCQTVGLKASRWSDQINLAGSPDAAIVLLELVSPANLGASIEFVDQAEQHVFWNLECDLERQLPVVFAAEYAVELERARQRIWKDT